MEPVQCILRECARAWGVSREDITGNTRKARVVQARFAAAYILRQSGLTMTDVGMELGGRDHSTISHACAQVLAQMASDEGYRLKINRIITTCGMEASEYIPEIGRVTDYQAYQLLKDQLRQLEIMRAQTLHAMSLLPEPPQRDIAPAWPCTPEIPPVGRRWQQVDGEWVSLNPVDKQGVGV